jgi:hypothetical protein
MLRLASSNMPSDFVVEPHCPSADVFFFEPMMIIFVA